MAVSRKRKKKRRRELGLIAVLVLCICSVIGYKKIQLQEEFEQKEIERQKLEEKIADEEERSDELKQKKAYMQTRGFIEEAARLMGLVYPEDIILKPEQE